MLDKEFIGMLACPNCGNAVSDFQHELVCVNSACQKRYKIEDGIPIMLPQLTPDLKLTLEKWEAGYQKVNWVLDWEYDRCLQDSDRFIRHYAESRKEGIYFEAGCGMAKNAFLLARDGFKVVGLDICLGALKKVKAKFTEHGLRGFFVCGDLTAMPFKGNLFGLIFAGGSIEHFSDTVKSVKELRRVLKNDGLLLATIPFVSLSTLTYGQLTGNIPDVPLLRQLAEFLHIKLLKKRLMRYGYEKSFTAGKIRRIFQQAGFNWISYGPYYTCWEIKFFSSAWIKRLLRMLSRWRIFWPFIYVLAEK